MSENTINILFVHLNYPGQFKELIASLLPHDNVRVGFITSKKDAKQDGVLIDYAATSEVPAGGHRYTKAMSRDVVHMQEVTKTALRMRRNGFVPHVVIGHIAWGGTILMKDVFPETKIIGYCEWYFRWQNSWQAFCHQHQQGPEADLNVKADTRFLNTTSLAALETMDVGVAPMAWQQSTFPEHHRRKIQVIHEGIDTQVCHKQAPTALRVPGAVLPEGAKIVSFIARSMEPARGFFTFMAAAEILAKQDPDVQFVVVGRPRSAYSADTGDGPSYKEQALEKYDLDWSRVHFCGKLPYADYLSVVRNSWVRVYLSMPLFLSWSLLESMACETPIVASENAPVNEVIQHNVNGRLAPFFDAEKFAEEIALLLQDRALAQRLGRAARQTVLERYDSKQCTKAWKNLILRTVNDTWLETT